MWDAAAACYRFKLLQDPVPMVGTFRKHLEDEELREAYVDQRFPVVEIGEAEEEQHLFILMIPLWRGLLYK
jgi:hypothetical protein